LNSRVEQPNAGGSAGDLVKYALALLLVAAGLFAFYWFNGQWPTVVRVLSVIAGLVAGGAVFMTTAKGAQTREFLGESRFELRKVVWPTRQEAMRTTWVVIVAVILMSLMLAGFDVVIQWGVKALLGT
jgi:preprotein translocase subunit SecE